MRKVYFIGGLGADKRVFSFLDLSFCEAVYIDWMEPLKNESLESYAGRLRNKIPETHPTIVGISFGGMLAAEMAKADSNVKAIIISSNKTAKEFPAWFRIGKYIPLYKWVPAAFSKRFVWTAKGILGAKGEEQQKLLRQIIHDTNARFSKWAIRAILHWKNREIPGNIVHIHGTADKLLPCRLVKADHSIKGGAHVMIMDKHQEISDILKKLIS